MLVSTRVCRSSLTLFALLFALVVSGCGTNASDSIRPLSQDSGSPNPPYAPYVNVGIGGSPGMPPDLGDLYTKSSADQLILFGIVSNGGACQPGWLNQYPLGSAFSQAVTTEIASLPGKAADVVLTFGSSDPTQYLETVCPDAASTAAQYAAAIRAYGVSSIDFDIEVTTPGTPSAQTVTTNQRRAAAISLLKTDPQYNDIAGSKISVTVPWETNIAYGQPSANDDWQSVQSVLNEMVNANVIPDMIVAEAMNYGNWWETQGNCAGSPAPDMFKCAQSTVQTLQTILQQQFPKLHSNWGAIGVEPMIGQNDVAPETFTVADASQLRTYANSTGLARLSMWSVGRDHPCPPSSPTSPTCSGIPDQADYAFSTALAN